MSLGGRWQKGLSHQACVASVSGAEKGPDRSGRQPVIPAYTCHRGSPCSPLLPLPVPHPLQGSG